jgi:serine/threonine-protein kinase
VTELLDQLKASLAGRYQLDRELGRGGMATVYLAQDLRHRRPVALKVLHPHLAMSLGPERFLREIQIAARLQHPHIVPLYDSGRADDLLYYVMPYIEGESLRQRLDRESPLPIEDALKITRAAAAALDYAHRRDIVHRDIKPENVMLHDGEAVVTDFGIAKAVSAAVSDSLTQTGTAVGTPAYMSPEQAGGNDELDGRSDIYSLGAMLYEMLGGTAPFTGPTVQSIMKKLFTDPVQPLRERRDEVPDWLEQAVLKALEKAPEKRFETATQFSKALDWPSGGSTPPGMPAGSSTGWNSIAVLPFANMSADPENEYFSDGIAEEIINALNKIEGLRVASRTSAFAFKGKNQDIGGIGRQLKVDAVLEGSVRKAGNRLRITAQLVNVSDGYQLWSERFDRQFEDVFAIQDEIAKAIAEALKLQLGSEQQELVAPAKNLEAYTRYLKGRFHYNKFTEPGVRKSLELYQHALLADPGYGRAHAGIADSWCRLADDWLAPDEAYPRAKAAATRALQLDPDLPEAMTVLGKVLGWYEWEFGEAERLLRRAVALSPNNAESHWALGSVLPSVGRLQEGLEELRRAAALDPLFALYQRWVGRFLLYMGNYDEAIAQSKATIDFDEEFHQAYLDLGASLFAQGDAEGALQAFQRGQSADTAVRSYDAFIVRALPALGRQDEAEEILDRLERESNEHYVRSEVLAMGYAAVGDLDKAFASLERAFQAKSGGLVYLHIDPGYAPLRDDSRFAELVERIGLK